MEQYTYLAVAPCTFTIDGTKYDLSAGQTVVVNDNVAAKINALEFPYRRFLNLIYKTEPSIVNAPEKVTKQTSSSKKVEEPATPLDIKTNVSSDTPIVPEEPISKKPNQKKNIT